MAGTPRIALTPVGSRPWLADAIRAGGGSVVAAEEAEVLVWAEPFGADELAELLHGAPGIHWVQLPWAGVEPFASVIDADHVWTSGKGVYAEPVAEHALAMMLAGLRGLVKYAGASKWSGPAGRNVLGGRVTILGGGFITDSLLRLLQPFDAHVTVVRRHPDPMPGVDRVLAVDSLPVALADVDAVVLALALTPETEGIIGRAELDAMPSHAWLVNVARGRHVVTDDLVDALRAGAIGGAALDVTDPEPLPEDHPLWSLPNCLITPHVGNTPDMAVPLLSARIAENVRRYGAGEPLIGLVDPALGY